MTLSYTMVKNEMYLGVSFSSSQGGSHPLMGRRAKKKKKKKLGKKRTILIKLSWKSRTFRVRTIRAG